MLRRIAPALALLLVVAACGDDDGGTTPTTPPTTTVAGGGSLRDTFDGTTAAVPFFPADLMGWDLSEVGFVTITSPAHPPGGTANSYFATYPDEFGDGSLTMRFQPGPAEFGALYSILFWVTPDLGDYAEAGVSADGTVYLSVRVAGGAPGVQTLGAPEGAFDPDGFNELRVEVSDSANVAVYLNDVLAGEVVVASVVTRGQVGFSLTSFAAGSALTVDEFVIAPAG